MIHPARYLSYDDLMTGIEFEYKAGNVSMKTEDSLALFTYTKQCVFMKNWNTITKACRGLIIDVNRRVIATPFPKFFNYGEDPGTVEALIQDGVPFRAFEKLDGSLIIAYFYDGRWRCATKGSFNSPQAQWAEKFMHEKLDLSYLVPGDTYLFEAVYPENRIVIKYDPELVLLGAYDCTGHEVDPLALQCLALDIGTRTPHTYAYNRIEPMLEDAKALSAYQEGWVVKFDNGFRIKIKGDEYCRIHRLISNVTPLAIWESMMNGDDLEAIKRDMPEEFWPDFDTIRDTLATKCAALLIRVGNEANKWEGKSNKDVGLALDTMPEDVRSLIFLYRRFRGSYLLNETRARKVLYKHIRPNGNVLEGYVPSSAMNRVAEEAS